MPISGPVVHQQLMDAYASVQEYFESERGRTSDARRQRDQLDENRDHALVSLAEHYLPELTPDAVRETWSEVRPTISQVMLRQQEHTGRVQTALQELTAQRQQQDQQLLDLNQELDEAIEVQQEVAEQVEQRLREDDQFVQLSDRAAVAEAALERAEANLQEIDQDAARKLPAYDESALFCYLRDHGYGTAEYTKRGFGRRMDRWLARFIDYHKSKQGYDFLRQTPEQMRKIIAEDRQAIDTVMDELERRRDQVAVSFRLPEKIEKVSSLQQRRDQQLQTLDALLTDLQQNQKDLIDLEDSRGTYYREAIRLFREMLSRSESSDLKQLAQQTNEITDDQIVARLMGVEMEIGQLDAAAEQRRDQLDQMQEFLDGLGRLIQRFRAAQFDSSRSQFVGSLDVFEELERARDQNDIDSMWRRIRSAQRWGPTSDDDRVKHVSTNPMSRVLVNAMSSAAEDEMQAHARRAGDRRVGRDSSRDQTADWGGGDSSDADHRRR